MEAARGLILRLSVALVAFLPIACNGLHPWESAPLPTTVSSPACTDDPSPLQRTAWASPAENEAPGFTTGPDDLAAMSELSLDALIGQVLARNPTLAQMIAAWQAASARYPQVTALDDPMFGAQVAPGAFGSNTVEGGYRLEISQKFPWCGKLALRGQSALAEASAARTTA